MKKLLLSVLLVALAGTASAGVLYDLNTGVYTEGDIVDVQDAVVTAVRYNGFAITELPAGPYTAVWVYSGTGTTDDLVPGDVVQITMATYEEYYDLTELNLLTNGGSFIETGTTAVPPLFCFTLSALMADPEPWEAHMITITDGFSVTAMLNYGEWEAKSWDSGLILRHDDWWFDETTLEVWDCYICASGMWSEGYGTYRLNVFADGITLIDCSVDNEPASFGQVKSLFR